MASSLLAFALTKKSFPMNLTFHSVIRFKTSPKKFIFRYFTNIYHSQPTGFSSFYPEHIFLTGFTLNPARDITEDELWFLWCLIVLYATSLFFLYGQLRLSSIIQSWPILFHGPCLSGFLPYLGGEDNSNKFLTDFTSLKSLIMKKTSSQWSLSFIDPISSGNQTIMDPRPCL